MPAGRISILAEPSADTRAAGMKGGAWVYATHDLADYQDILNSIHKSLAIGAALVLCIARPSNKHDVYITAYQHLCSVMLSDLVHLLADS